MRYMVVGDSSPIGQLNKQQAHTSPAKESFSATALSAGQTVMHDDVSLANIQIPTAVSQETSNRLTLHRHILLCVVLFVLLIVATAYERIVSSIVRSDTHPTMYATIRTVYTQVIDTLGLFGIQNTHDPVAVLSTNIKNTHYFPYTKLLIQDALDDLSNEFVQIQKRLDTKKQEIAEFGFVSSDVQKILLTDGQKVSLQRSLLALEAVKFTAALKVFPYLQSFVSGLADYTNTDTDTITKQLTLISTASDDLLASYLSMCYTNPLEISDDCDIVNDFSTWISTNTRYAASLDVHFFMQLMRYIDIKLEDDQIPQFALQFQRYDPKNSTLTFSIEVNTFQEDEVSLTQRGIQNPHTFIVTNIINLLKKSQFIIGSSVDTKQIQIKPKVVTIGSQKFVVNNSLMQFTLPVQERVQREIFDAAP